MKIWAYLKKRIRAVLYARRLKKSGLEFPLLCSLRGTRSPDRQGALVQSAAGDRLQFVHVPVEGYPFNVYVYSIPLNRVLGYLQESLSVKLVDLFGKKFCRDGVIEYVARSERDGQPLYGAGVRVFETMQMMENVKDFSHLHGEN